MRLGPDGEPDAAICPRVTSERSVGHAGYLHQLKPGSHHRPRHERSCFRRAPRRDFSRLMEWLHSESVSGLGDLSAELGIPPEGLEAVGFVCVEGDALRAIGYEGAKRAWAVPMYDAQGRVIGIRLRVPGAGKRAVKGSANGLFITQHAGPFDIIAITEGESDAACLASCGISALGRPGALGAIDHAVAFATAKDPLQVVVVADRDEVGWRGAQRLFERLGKAGLSARIVTPPEKDVRAWMNAGASCSDVRQLVLNEPLPGVDRA